MRFYGIIRKKPNRISLRGPLLSGNEFFLVRDVDGKQFAVVSYGADKEEGGEDYNADLYSTDSL